MPRRNGRINGRELVQRYLRKPSNSPSDVVELLGFEDQSNFFRACTRWFGESLALLDDADADRHLHWAAWGFGTRSRKLIATAQPRK